MGQPSEGEAPPPCEREVHWTVLWRSWTHDPPGPLAPWSPLWPLVTVLAPSSPPYPPTLRQCLGPGLAVLLTLVVNMITVAQYTALPIKGQIHSLHTIMYYSYFAAQCLGTISVLHPAVRRCPTLPLSLVTSQTQSRHPSC